MLSLVVVELGAAVVVVEAVEVLGLVRALVLGVGAAIAVVVVVGAAVVVLEAVHVLGDRAGTCRAPFGMPSPSLSRTSGA